MNMYNCLNGFTEKRVPAARNDEEDSSIYSLISLYSWLLTSPPPSYQKYRFSATRQLENNMSNLAY